MRINTNTLKKWILYYLVGCVIFIGIQMLFNVKDTTSSFTTISETYNINNSLTESEVLKVLESENIISAVEKEGFYILKSDTSKYYQVPITDTISLGLELAGVNLIQPQSKVNIVSVLFWVLLIFFTISLIIRFVISMYRERSIINAAEHLAYMGMQNGGMVMEEEEKSDVEDKKETIRIKKVTFEDVQGIEELKPDLYRLVDCLKNPDKYKKIGARMPKGVILYGPPGTGKTLTAKALAGEAGVPFFSMCGSDFMEKYVGVGASRIRELYKKARKSAPCIVFIDEIDAIGGGRGEANSSEKDQTINALLAELDGFKSADNVLTICATNRLDILDPALLRAGRFDLKLAVGLPDKEGRIEILKLHSKNKCLMDEVDIESIAKKTIGFSGAELENLLNESALIAANNNKEVIDNEDIENAFFKVIMDGNKKKRKEIDEDTYLTAWHEAGHTLATKLLTKDGVPTVTIIQSTSGAGGVTFMAPDEKNLPSKKYLKNKIKISYAGRAAEELYLEDSEEITTGASQDIKQATSIIKSFIGAYGMGNKGLIDIKQLTYQYDIVEEATELSNALYKETLVLLTEHKEQLKALANKLVEKETLYEEEIDKILGISQVGTLDLSKSKEGTEDVDITEV